MKEIKRVPISIQGPLTIQDFNAEHLTVNPFMCTITLRGIFYSN